MKIVAGVNADAKLSARNLREVLYILDTTLPANRHKFTHIGEGGGAVYRNLANFCRELAASRTRSMPVRQSRGG